MGIQDREYYREEERGFRITSPRSVVVTLIIINLVIFVVDAFSGNSSPISKNLSSFMAVKTDVFQHPWRLYELLTAGFAHSPVNGTHGFFHVFGNMLVLFFLGRDVEAKYGGAEFLKIYLIAIVISSLGWLLFQLAIGHTGGMLGASGAVSAIVILFIINFPHRELMFWGVFPIKAWIVGTIIIGQDMIRAFAATKSEVAWEAHLAGAAFGAAYYYLNWNFRWIDFTWLQNWFTNVKQARKRKHLKIHRPPEENSKLLADADRVLAKISKEGEGSLTKKERKILEKYSRMMRDKNT